jgi:Putative lumazine-binding
MLRSCNNDRREPCMYDFLASLRAALPAIAAIAMTLSLVPASRAASAEQKAVLASFQAMLNGLGKRDKAAMMAQLLPGGSATLMRNGKPLQMTFDSLTDRLSQPGPELHEERIHDALIRVDGDVAIIWAPFEFLLNGKIDHCGRDIATLVRVDGRWLIASIEDNGHKDHCGVTS